MTMRGLCLVVALLAACRGHARTPTEPAPPPAAIDAAPAAADPPEPAAPLAECVFDRAVWCEDGLPTRTALQPAFPWCATTQPARQPLVYSGDAQFSAAETRVRRATAPAACCYVEFVARACL